MSTLPILVVPTVIAGHSAAALRGPAFARRRQMLMDAYGPGSVVVVRGGQEQVRNSDVEHPFRQASDLWFLTGFAEPEAILVLAPGRAGEQVVLFVRPSDRAAETWHGRRAGLEGAVSRFGADKAFPVADFEQELARLCEGAQQVCVTLGQDAAFDAQVVRAARRHRLQPRLGLDGPDHLTDPAAVLWEMRLHKGEEELAALRRAGAVSAEAHHEAMRLAVPGIGEWEMQAALEYVCRAAGSQRLGYGSIVAAGVNATILHYTNNDERAVAGDLILIDAGTEIAHHTADITRTFPVSGQFSPAQRAVYEVVLDAQKRAIDVCRVGHSFQDVHDTAVRHLTAGMVALGLLAGPVDDRIADESYKRYYMHRTSHWLGIDVHDVGLYRVRGQWRPLTPGMVLTVEPGLYIAADDEAAPADLRGIGVRIEDDVLVTSGDPDVLTAGCVKEILDIEALVGTGALHVSGPASLQSAGLVERVAPK